MQGSSNTIDWTGSTWSLSRKTRTGLGSSLLDGGCKSPWKIPLGSGSGNRLQTPNRTRNRKKIQAKPMVFQEMPPSTRWSSTGRHPLTTVVRTSWATRPGWNGRKPRKAQKLMATHRVWLVHVGTFDDWNPPAPKVLGRDLPDGTRKRLQVYLGGGAFFGQNLLFLIGRDARLQKTL